jgi:DNA anti-recombination protein RmuC
VNLRSLSLSLALAIAALFSAMNWGAITAPTELSLGFAKVQAPLGLVLLALTGMLSALFLVYIAFQQASVIAEARRTARELKGHRELADRAEASRFTALQNDLADQLRRLDAQRASESERMNAAIDQMEKRIIDRLDESTRVMSAFVGEVDEKLDRMLASRPA